MKQINNTYYHRWYRINDCNAANAFELLRYGLTALQIKLNRVGEYEHIPEI